MTNALAIHTIKYHVLNASENFVSNGEQAVKNEERIDCKRHLAYSTFPSISTISSISKLSRKRKIFPIHETLENCYLFHIVYIVFNQIALNKILYF